MLLPVIASQLIVADEGVIDELLKFVGVVQASIVVKVADTQEE